MTEKILLAATLLFAFFVYQMDKRLDDIALSIDSNNAILITLRDRAKKLQAEEKVEKLKANIRALGGTECEKCHVTNENLVLPKQDGILTLEAFMEVVRNGNAYMPAFNEEQMSEARLKKIYEALYAIKKR
ncbi:c-type cytochrome [Helicobacter bilis]|uniref:c-type cytochrome n=1 Tax=Helicobacter bilis TaxID=37372 RepID=UPI000CF11162|nr:c-type cytochrome [Helicobacter bilis]